VNIHAPVTAAFAAENAGALVDQQLLIGQHYYDEGHIDQAIAAFHNGLQAARSAGVDQISADVLAELHARLGDAYMVSRRFGSAAAQYKSALRLEPTLVACWCNLGNAQLQTGNTKDAIARYGEALKLFPANWTLRTSLAQALMAEKQYIRAKALLMELARERPQDGELRHLLGKTCFRLNDFAEARRHFEAALAINPRNADNHYWIGGVWQRMGDIDAARAAYAQGAEIRPVIRREAVKSPADFRLLALFAPYAGNTPCEYLFKEAAYDTDTLALFDGSELDAASLGDVQLVVNLISDADQARLVLPAAARLVEKLGKPVINDPGKIQHTTRDAVARLLPGISDCHIPRLLRLDAGADLSAAALAKQLPFSFPVLARPAGTHGGDDFEKIASLSDLASFLGNHPDSDHYVIEYIDYASADGHFRKYRFIFVGDEILPYHLAIGNDWKVHHASTDMVNQRWMQREEAAFLARPDAVFTAENYRALRTIRERIELDYFGIDCGLDDNGDIVVFEVNASMLVHDDNAEFPYKDPSVRAIKRAFNAMLHQRATSVSA
jgi:tetratricopeptide (TPR) repeat protein/glutathione synthase/RimK-type ligase-like ATP-grasp enzyme